MADEITNVGTDTTQVVADATNEVNTVEDQQTQVTAQEGNEQPPVENSNQEVNDESTREDDTQELTNEQLMAKLKEYEVREEEDRMIREKLGLQDIDQQTYNYMNLDQQIVNAGKQEYLKLCNEYSINADPNKIDESLEELKKTDPARAYEFQRKFEMLSADVENRRNYIQQENTIYEVNKFQQDYNQLLNVSPAISNIMTQYVQNYGYSGNMYGQLKGVMDVILPAYQEAFEAGKMYALQGKAKQDTSAVSGGIATANTNTYNSGTVFTREQIARMSTDEFAKYEKVIAQQIREGRI